MGEMGEPIEAEILERLMHLAARVHWAQEKLRPLVDPIVTKLHRDPLGGDDTGVRLAQVLDSDFAREARAVRAQLVDELDATLPHRGQDRSVAREVQTVRRER
jgi:hypothetical protein